jgi:hypothetical protein
MAAPDRNQVFDSLKDALDEASWCAGREKRAYIIRQTARGYRVSLKSRMQKDAPHIEVGFKDTKHENKDSRKSAPHPR